jgi:surface carbohydrate biosynthesis protein
MERPPLIMPVENQVRELDAKLLLACVAAGRGIPSIVGPKREVEFGMAAFPRGVFLAKSLRIGNRKFFPVCRRLGHAIAAWDEEALVHLPDEIYYSRRLPERGLEHVSHLFAWGADNAELWRRYPGMPAGLPIHITGNPRNDLLRAEIHPYYDAEAESLRRRFGDFILLNTNFNHVNAFHDGQNLFRTPPRPGAPPEMGQAAAGMPRAYAEGLRRHKQRLFEHFLKLIPMLEAAFPDHTVVVRPHPTERHDPYRSAAQGCRRVAVLNTGNVVPWLKAAKVLVHNGCTTGVEAFVMRVPAVSYRPCRDAVYDEGFYRLPNRLSHACFGSAELLETVAGVLSGRVTAVDGDGPRAEAARHLAALEGPLACERIVGVLEPVVDAMARAAPVGVRARVSGWFQTSRRRIRQTIKSRLPGARKSAAFMRHRYPPLAAEDVAERLSRFQKALGAAGALRLTEISPGIFLVGP